MATDLRIGVIGVGGMGACHAGNVADLAGLDLVWVADPDEPAGTAVANSLSTQWLAEGADGLNDVDAVIIACPDRFHHRYTIAALERELPVLCEKPLTVDIADASDIVDRERALGRRLVHVGFMREYDQAHQQVHAALGDLGVVRHLRCVHRNTNTEARSVAQLLVESIIHDIHSVRWLSGSEIRAVQTSIVTSGERATFVVLTCELASGAVATIEFDDAATGYEVSVEVTADRGNVVMADPPRAIVRARGQAAVEIGADWFSPFLGAYRTEMLAWRDSLTTGIVTGPSAWDGLAAQAVVEAAARSAVQGQPVTVDMGAQPSLYAAAEQGSSV